MLGLDGDSGGSAASQHSKLPLPSPWSPCPGVGKDTVWGARFVSGMAAIGRRLQVWHCWFDVDINNYKMGWPSRVKAPPETP